MARVIGVGAVMIYANDPSSLARWYAKVLGIETSDGGDSGCLYGVITNPATGVETQFAFFRAGADLGKSGRSVMVNYQVDDIDRFLERARDEGAEIEKRDDNEYGRFAHLKDSEGNPIEIWQAPASGGC